MAELVGLHEIVTHLGGTVRLKYSAKHKFFIDETVTGSISGATAVVKSIDSSEREIIVEPTSSIYFQLGEGISGSITIGTGLVIVLSEITALSMYYLSAVDFIKKFTGKLYGSTVPSLVKKYSTRAGQRYLNLWEGPLNAINSLILNDTTLTEDDGFWVNYRTGRIDFNKHISAPTKPNNLIIDIDYGTETVPSAVKLAAQIFVSHIWELRNRNLTTKGAQSISFGGRSVNFGRPVADPELQGILPEISVLLKQVSTIRVG